MENNDYLQAILEQQQQFQVEMRNEFRNVHVKLDQHEKRF